MTIPDFLEYLRKDPCFECKVNIEVFKDSGRGLGATQKIRKGDIVLRVPINKIITPCQADRLVTQLTKGRDIAWTDTRKLCALLLVYKLNLANDAFWSTYINEIPQDYDLPFLKLPPSEINDLSLQLQNDLRLQRQRYEQDHECLSEWFYVVYGIELESKLCKWAWCAINTRVLTLKRNNGEVLHRAALVPLFDMFNHSPEASDSKILVEDNSLVVRAGSDYDIGEEVFICYGHHDNEFLWREYGFILNGCNNFDFYNLDHYFEGLSDDHELCDLVVTRDGASWKLVNACRYFICTRETDQSQREKMFLELKHIRLGLIESFSNEQVEAKARQLLKKILLRELGNLSNKTPQNAIAKTLLETNKQLLQHATI